jgi:hypothetical protein
VTSEKNGSAVNISKENNSVKLTAQLLAQVLTLKALDISGLQWPQQIKWWHSTFRVMDLYCREIIKTAKGDGRGQRGVVWGGKVGEMWEQEK